MIVKTVGEVLAGRDLPAVQADVCVLDACEIMDGFDVGAVVVLSGDRMVGILSERDAVRRCLLMRGDPVEMLASDIMTTDPVTIDVRQGLAEAIALLEQGRFRHLPVMDGDRPVGLLSFRDIPAEYRMLLERFREMRAG